MSERRKGRWGSRLGLRSRVVFAATFVLLFVAASLGLAAVDQFFRHGLTTVYWLHGGEHEPLERLFERHEPRPQMLGDVRARGLVRQAVADRGVFVRPTQPWRFEVAFRGTLTIPGSAGRKLRVRSPNTVSLFIDGVRAEGTTVPAGRHALVARWHVDEPPARPASPADARGARLREPAAGFVLEWEVRPSRFRTVPTSALRPATPRSGARAVALWMWAAAMAAFAFSVAVAFRRRQRAAAFAQVALIAIVGFGAVLRTWDHSVAPLVYPEEVTTVVGGAALCSEGRPVVARTSEVLGVGPKLLMPLHAIGHAPLALEPRWARAPFGQLLFGCGLHPAYPNIAGRRWLPIVLSLVTVVLVFVAARLYWRRRPAIAVVAALLTSVLPFASVAGRLAVGAAWVPPLSLIALLSWLVFERNERPRWLWVTATASALAVLASWAGAATLVGFAWLAWRRDGWRALGPFAALGMAAAATVGAIAASADGLDGTAALFASIKADPVTPWSRMLRLIASPEIAGDRVGRGWALFLWLGSLVGMVTARNRDDIVLAVPLATLLLASLGIGSADPTIIWLCMCPWLCLGAGRFVSDLWHRPSLPGGLILVGLGAMYGLNFLLPLEQAFSIFYWKQIRTVVTWTLVACLGPFILVLLSDRRVTRVLCRVVIVVALALTLVGATRFAIGYASHDVERYRHFDKVEFFNG